MKKFQKISSLILLLSLVFSLAACGKKPDGPFPSSAPTVPTTAPTDPTKPINPHIVVANTEGMTELQKAIVVTAESYYLRGKYAQYDQYDLTKKSSAGIENVNRRLVGVKAPEDYTAQNYGYTDCSGFVYDVYLFALNMAITDGESRTKFYCEYSPHTILSEQPEKGNFAQMTAQQLSAKEKEFTDTLQPGDIIVYRTAGNKSGHAMLYVGNGMIIHSTGSTYDFSAGADKVEKNGTCRHDSIKAFFQPGSSRYLFDKHIYIIMRPLNQFQGEIPTHTRSRMELMRGIVAEKLSSHTYGQTVSPGEAMTFTFRIKNSSPFEKTLTVNETVPTGTTYTSGAQTISGNRLSWSVTVPAGKTAEVSYSVQVNPETAPGTYIQSESFISDIPVVCPRVLVANTLSTTQQQAIRDAVKEFSGGAHKGIALANAIYEKACGKTIFTHQTTDEIWAEVVIKKTRDYALDSTLPLYSAIAPCLYGGQNLCEFDANSPAAQARTRLVTNDALVVGDVVLADDRLYIFTGDGLYDLMMAQSGGLKNPESLLAAKRFVVLRPSMTF